MGTSVWMCLFVLLYHSARAQDSTTTTGTRCYDCNYAPSGYIKGLENWQNGGAAEVGYLKCGLTGRDDWLEVDKRICESGRCFIRQDDNGLVYRGCADYANLPWDVSRNMNCKYQGPNSLWWFCDGDICNDGQLGETEERCGSPPPAAENPAPAHSEMMPHYNQEQNDAYQYQYQYPSGYDYANYYGYGHNNVHSPHYYGYGYDSYGHGYPHNHYGIYNRMGGHLVAFGLLPYGNIDYSNGGETDAGYGQEQQAVDYQDYGDYEQPSAGEVEGKEYGGSYAYYGEDAYYGEEDYGLGDPEADQYPQPDDYDPCDGTCKNNPSGLFADPYRPNHFIQCGVNSKGGKPCTCCKKFYLKCNENTIFENSVTVCVRPDKPY